MAIPSVARYRSRDDVRVEAAGSGAVVVDLASGRCFELKGTGRDIWKMICSGISLRDIAAKLSETFGVELHRVERDVIDLVDSLEREGLVIRIPEDSP